MSDPITRLNTALEGRYEIERELGEGGMATVYLAKDLKHNRNVALKVLKPDLAAVVGAERFLAEIKTTANLTHPHILPLFDSGEADSFLFYVMPHIEGESLRERIDREKQLPVDEAVKIATDLAEALDYAHRHKIIHRDIKPANILIHEGRPLIADFGIALAVGAAGGGRLTETGLSVGTPHYMSPEQATGDQAVGVATDIYALGAVLYEMLIGEPPYTGSSPDSRWVAYQSNETGVEEVYVRSFPDPGQQIRVSDGGGQFPRWTQDGTAIYYWGAENLAVDRLFAARFTTEPTFSAAASAPSRPFWLGSLSWRAITFPSSGTSIRTETGF